MPQPHKIKSPEALLKYFNDYIKWAEENPLIELDAVYNARLDKWVDRRKLKPITEDGFCTYVGKQFVKGKQQTKNTKDYLRNKDGYYDDYVEVSVYIKSYITSFLLEHASVKTFEPGTVARIVGNVTQDAKLDPDEIKPLTINIIKK